MKGACINCKYHDRGSIQGQFEYVHLCGHPNYADPVTGLAVIPCKHIRAIPTLLSYLGGGCGRSGRYFNPNKIEVRQV